MLHSINQIIIAGYALALIATANWVSREKAGHKNETADYILACKALA